MARLNPALRLLARLLPLGALLWVLILLVRTFAARVTYPFDLEWMEGGMLVHALRVRQGLPLYVEPSADFIPYIYPPLYPWILAALSRFVDLGHGLGRSVSLAGVLAAAGFLVLAVRQERLPLTLGLGGAALFLSTYDESGAFFDLVRNDGVAVGFMAGAVTLTRRGTPWAVRSGALLLALAFTAKHNFAILGLPMGLVLWRTSGWRRAASFAAWSAGPAGLFTAAMQLSSDGRFLTYLLAVPATHPLVGQRLFPGAELDLAGAFPWALGGGLVVALAHFRRWGPAATWWVATMGTGLVAVVLMRAHHGGFVNVLIPGFWFLALGATLGLGLLIRRFAHPVVHLAVAALVALQCGLGGWSPERYTPTDADRAAGETLLETLRSWPGPVLMPASPWYPVMVGKEPGFHLIALWDVTHRRSPFGRVERKVREAILERRWDAVILASDRFEYGLDQAYRRVRTLHFPSRALMPKTGWKARPRLVYEPRPPGEPDAGEEAEPARPKDPLPRPSSGVVPRLGPGVPARVVPAGQ